MRLTYTIWLIVINFIVFIAQVILHNVDLIKTSYGEIVTDVLGLNPTTLIQRGWVWQIFTYMFVHADFAHIFYNMFGLLIFGPKIEATMGKDRFLKYYLLCGIGSSIFYGIIMTAAMGISNTPMVGASGAIFGVLTAYGLMYPRDIIYVQFFIPVPAFLFVAFYGFIQILGGVLNLLVPSQFGGIAYFGHLGGMITGIILLKFFGYERRRIRYFWE